MKRRPKLVVNLKEVFLNPFFMYGITMLGAIVFYLLHWVAYPSLQGAVLYFLMASVLLAFALGFIRVKALNDNKQDFARDRMWRFFVCMVVFLSVSVGLTLWYAGKVPLFKILFSQEVYNYRTDFAPIKYFTILITSLNTTLIVFFVFMISKYREWRYLYLMATSVLLLFLFGSRGMLMVALLPSVIIALYYIRFNLPKIIIVGCLLGALMYLFGVYGDLREGAKTRTDYSLYEDEHSDRYPTLLPSKFIWVYYYYTSPLVKFSYVVHDEEVKTWERDCKTMFFVEMLPYSIARRLYPEYEDKARKSEHGYASYYVGTAFDDVYLYARWQGVLLYTFYFFLFLGAAFVVAKRYVSSFYVPIMAIVVSIAVLSVFDNMLSFSPIIFQLYWMFVLAFVLSKFFNRPKKA